MSPGHRKKIVQPDHPNLSLSAQCRILKISRSSLYYRPVPVRDGTLALMKAIDRLFTAYPFFGSRQIVAMVKRDGLSVGRHRVRRLMRRPLGRLLRNRLSANGWGWRLSIAGRRPVSRTRRIQSIPTCCGTSSSTARTRSPFRRCAHRLPGKGCADITFVPVSRGYLYLVAIRCPAVVCLQTMRGGDPSCASPLASSSGAF